MIQVRMKIREGNHSHNYDDNGGAAFTSGAAGAGGAGGTGSVVIIFFAA